MSDPAHDHADDGHVHVHVHSTRFYLGVLGALLTLTVLTVLTAVYLDLDGLFSLGDPARASGGWNLALAMIIATTKATLVCVFFMHLREDKRFNALVFVGSLLFVGIFFAYTLNDTDTRGQMGDIYNGVQVDPERGTLAPGGIDYAITGEAHRPGFDRTLAKETVEKPAAAAEATPAEVPQEALVEEALLDAEGGPEGALEDDAAPEDAAAVEADEAAPEPATPPEPAEAAADEAAMAAPQAAERAAPQPRRAAPARRAAEAPANLADPEEEATPGD